MESDNKKIMVAGAGISGISAVELLISKGRKVVLYDGGKTVSEDIIKEKLKKVELDDFDKIEIIIGDIKDEDIRDVELCIISPGIPMDNPLVEKLKSKGIKIWSEIELAYNYEKGKVIGITGTNGKTTTTALTGAIMKRYNENTFVVGNIGIPYTKMAKNTKEGSYTVAEISSFQLETIEKFHPVISAVLNITPDHLDRHKTMEEYARVKMNICKNQSETEVCILNYEDDIIREHSKNIRCKIIYFSSKRELKNGFFMKEGLIYKAVDGNSKKIIGMDETKLVGIHNGENIMAAIAMVESAGVPEELYVEVIKNFNSIEHRIEYVDTIKGVIYYNDSKGTNTDASVKALEAMSRNTVLIAGGYDKHSDFDEWVDAFGSKIKKLILIGATKEKIANTARKHGFNNIVLVDSLEEAVLEAYKSAEEGEAVLLSPACASWDMFKSYEERGNLFKEYISKLI